MRKRFVIGFMLLMLVLTLSTSLALAYPRFREFSEKQSGRTVNCAMCHANAEGPLGPGAGQLDGLSESDMKKVEQARNAMEPGVNVDSPIMNRFGNHIIKTIGMKMVFAAAGDPQILVKALGDKSDLDNDGIADSQEFLDGTDPLNKFNGDPQKLFWINLSRDKLAILFVAVSVALIVFGLSHFIRGVKGEK